MSNTRRDARPCRSLESHMTDLRSPARNVTPQGAFYEPVRDTTLTHQCFIHKTQSDTFTNPRYSQRSSSCQPRRRGRVGRWCKCRLWYLTRTPGQNFRPHHEPLVFRLFCEAGRPTALTFPFRPRRQLAKLLLHYPEVV